MDVRAVEEGGTPKNLGYLSSIIYLIICTFGMPCIYMPIVYYQCGVLVAAIIWIFYATLSIYVNLLMIQGMKLIKGNEKYQLSIEYVGLVKELFSRKVFLIFKFIYFVFLFCANIYMIRMTDYVMENIVGIVAGDPAYTFAIQVYPKFEVGRFQVSQFYGGNSNFGITLGYLIVALMQVPMGIFQFNGFTIIQAFGALLVAPLSIAAFIYEFSEIGINKVVPLIGNDFRYVVGMVIFSLGIGSFMPAWINQKKPYVKEKKILFGISLATMILNVAFPILAAYTYGSSLTFDLFERVLETKSLFVRLMVYMFNITLIASLTPLNAITLKNNLYTETALNKGLSIFFGVFAQYLVAWIFLQEGPLVLMIQYANLLLGSFIGFFFPLAIFYRSLSNYRRKDIIPHSIIVVWPKWIISYYRPTTIAIALCVAIPALGQIIYDIYYLAAYKQSLV